MEKVCPFVFQPTIHNAFFHYHGVYFLLILSVLCRREPELCVFITVSLNVLIYPVAVFSLSIASHNIFLSLQ